MRRFFYLRALRARRRPIINCPQFLLRDVDTIAPKKAPGTESNARLVGALAMT